MIEYECPGFCPVDCGPNEIQCNKVDANGCDLPAQCISAMSKCFECLLVNFTLHKLAVTGQWLWLSW